MGGQEDDRAGEHARECGEDGLGGLGVRKHCIHISDSLDEGVRDAELSANPILVRPKHLVFWGRHVLVIIGQNAVTHRAAVQPTSIAPLFVYSMSTRHMDSTKFTLSGRVASQSAYRRSSLGTFLIPSPSDE